jgi:deazaflavin-dependent oxidoreductase (nitroreductase family)
MASNARAGRTGRDIGGRVTQRFPRWFLRAPELIFRLRLSWLAPTLVMLVTTGRRTGRKRAVVLDVARIDRSGLWVIAGDGMRARWVLNLAADPAVEVWHRGRRWRGRATVGGIDAGELNVDIYRDRPLYTRLVYRLIGERIRDESDVRRLARGTIAVRIERVADR